MIRSPGRLSATQGALHIGWSRLLLPMVMVGLLACTAQGSESVAGPDSDTDAGPDAGMDVGTDAGADSGTDSGMDSGTAEWRIFLTNTFQAADLGGTAGADELCAAQAAAANLEGDFKAWLSTASSPVSDRLTHASGPYVLVDGTLVANDWDDLVDGSLIARIDRDANGELLVGDVWTGTLVTGAPYLDDDCEAFTSSAGDRTALCGASASVTATWTQNITPACSTALRLYCIEQ
jgi:hypothetical protein